MQFPLNNRKKNVVALYLYETLLRKITSSEIEDGREQIENGFQSIFSFVCISIRRVVIPCNEVDDYSGKRRTRVRRVLEIL